MRQALIIVAAVIVIAGVGVGVYFMFFAGGANIIVAPSGDADTLPEAGSVPTAPVDEETPVVDIEQPRQVAARLKRPGGYRSRCLHCVIYRFGSRSRRELYCS